MRWRHKAAVQGLLARTPGGAVAYRQLQRRLGTLGPDPFKRLPKQAVMLRGLQAMGMELEGARCLEVGTGHVPIAPVGFFLAGAAEVLTVDLHRRMDLSLTSRMLQQLAADPRVPKLYEGLVAPAGLHERLEVVARHADRPLQLFERIGLRYVAPGDASTLPDPDGSYDVHFSMTVLEHVEPTALVALLAEARRLLAPDGVAVHFVDPSDHFSHQDPTIERINFLRYTADQWRRIAGNEFSYTNRLRASQLAEAFEHAGLHLERVDQVVDERSLVAIRDGFLLAPEFRSFEPEDLCTTTWRAYARPSATFTA